MKYENLDKAKTIADKIDKLYYRRKQLTEQDPVIEINITETDGTKGCTCMTVGATKGYEHPYTPLAVKFVEQIVIDIDQAISGLKNELEKL